MTVAGPKKKTSLFTWFVAFLMAVFLLPLIITDRLRGKDEPTPKQKAAAAAEKAEAAKREQDGLWVATVEERIKGALKDGDSATFRNARTYHGSGVPVVCGEVNAKNGFGGYSGFQRFVGAGEVLALEEQMAAGEMQRLWNKVCR